MNILITGGAGFIGGALVRELQARHPAAALTVIDDFRGGDFANLSSEGRADVPAFSFAGDLVAAPLHELDLPRLLVERHIDTVYHLASITDTTVDDAKQMVHENVTPFRHLLRWVTEAGHGPTRAELASEAADVPATPPLASPPAARRLVWASSAATYGVDAGGAVGQRRAFVESDAGRPANVYGFSKWLMENLHRVAAAAHPAAHLVGLRYFNVFGPGEGHKGPMASMVRQIADTLLAGRAPRLFNPGTQTRDHVHVSDVVAATRAAARPGARPGIYNVGTGTATTFNALTDTLRRVLDVERPTTFVPNPHRFYQPHTQADLSASTEALGWAPSVPTLEGVAAYARRLRDTWPNRRPGVPRPPTGCR